MPQDAVLVGKVIAAVFVIDPAELVPQVAAEVVTRAYAPVAGSVTFVSVLVGVDVLKPT